MSSKSLSKWFSDLLGIYLGKSFESGDGLLRKSLSNVSCVLGIFGAQRYLKRRNSCATDIAGLAVSRDLFCVGDWTVRVGIFENRPRQISPCALLRWIQTL